MTELIKYIVESFAEHPDQIVYDIDDNGKFVNVIIYLAEGDMGKVIGRQGKIAKALRTLVRAGQNKENKKYNIEIKELGGKE